MMQRMSLTLAVNGKSQEVPTGSLLPDLLKTLGLADAQVAKVVVKARASLAPLPA